MGAEGASLGLNNTEFNRYCQQLPSSFLFGFFFWLVVWFGVFFFAFNVLETL